MLGNTTPPRLPPMMTNSDSVISVGKNANPLGSSFGHTLSNNNTRTRTNSFTTASSGASSFVKTKISVDTSDQLGFAVAGDDSFHSSGKKSAFSVVQKDISRSNGSHQMKGGATYNKELKTLPIKNSTGRPSTQTKSQLSQNKADMGKKKKSSRARKTTAKDKSDHRSASTTRTSSAGDFTFASTASTASRSDDPQSNFYIPNDDLSALSDDTRNLSRQKYYGTTQQPSSTRLSSAQPSVGSSTWAPVDEMWGHDLHSVQQSSDAGEIQQTRPHQVDAKKHAPPASMPKQKSPKRKKKKSKAKGRDTPSKQEIIKEMNPPPLSEEEQSTQHVRKTQRRSQTERTVTQESPKSVSSEERPTVGRGLSTREEFRAFLVQDQLSQRDLVKGNTKTKEARRHGRVVPHARKAKPSKKESKKERKRKKKQVKSKSDPTTLEDKGRESRASAATRPIHSITPSTSSEGSRKARVLMQKHASMSTIETSSTHDPSMSPDTDISPGLTTFFEWTRSPPEPRRRVYRVPSSRGIVDRREILRKARSVSDLHQYHLTPEWPTPRRNERLHSLFYDLSLRRQDFDSHIHSSPGVPCVSARQMLSIMEPCSRREIVTAQGWEFELPLYRDDMMFNVGEILDNISLASSKRTQSSDSTQ